LVQEKFFNSLKSKQNSINEVWLYVD